MVAQKQVVVAGGDGAAEGSLWSLAFNGKLHFDYYVFENQYNPSHSKDLKAGCKGGCTSSYPVPPPHHLVPGMLTEHFQGVHCQKRT